ACGMTSPHPSLAPAPDPPPPFDNSTTSSKCSSDIRSPGSLTPPRSDRTTAATSKRTRRCCARFSRRLTRVASRLGCATFWPPTAYSSTGNGGHRGRCISVVSIVFIAANQGVPWGASEFLWSRAAHTLAASSDVEVAACVKSWSLGLDPIEELRSVGCRIIARLKEEDERAFEMCEVPPAPTKEVLQLRPDLVVISHGDNREGLPWMELCSAHGIRYVSLAHRASEWDWPPPFVIPRLRSAYLAASAAHFVSEHNRRLTEQMICA